MPELNTIGVTPPPDRPQAPPLASGSEASRATPVEPSGSAPRPAHGGKARRRRLGRRWEAWIGRLSKRRSRQGLYSFLEEQYSTIPAGSEVLSIGAGGEVNELLRQAAQRNGFSFATFDIDPARGPDIVGDICQHDFGGRQFDAVVISEVLEHLTAPAQGVQTVHRILKPNGRLILTTPFILPMHDRPYDYFRFTRYGLELLLRDFRQVEVRERNSYFEAIDVLWVRLVLANAGSARRVSWFLIPAIYYLKRPFTLLLNRLVPTDAMTTGYVVSAVK